MSTVEVGDALIRTKLSFDFATSNQFVTAGFCNYILIPNGFIGKCYYVFLKRSFNHSIGVCYKARGTLIPVNLHLNAHLTSEPESNQLYSPNQGGLMTISSNSSSSQSESGGGR